MRCCTLKPTVARLFVLSVITDPSASSIVDVPPMAVSYVAVTDTGSESGRSEGWFMRTPAAPTTKIKTNEAAMANRRVTCRTGCGAAADICGNTSDKRASTSILSHICAIESSCFLFRESVDIQVNNVSVSSSDSPLSIFAIHSLASTKSWSSSLGSGEN